MAIALQGLNNSGAMAQNPWTWTHVCAGEDRLLLIFLSVQAPPTSPSVFARYGEVFCKKLRTDGVAGTNSLTEIWYLANPPTGSHTITVRFSGARFGVGGSVSLTGVNLNSWVDGLSGTQAIDPSTIITVANESSWTIDVVNLTTTLGTDPVADASQTELYNVQYTNSLSLLGNGAVSAKINSASGSSTMAWATAGYTATQSVVGIDAKLGDSTISRVRTIRGVRTMRL